MRASAGLMQPEGQPLGRPYVVGRAPGRLDQAGSVLQHLSTTAGLCEREVAELTRTFHFVRQHTSQTELCTQGELQTPRILLTGWACQQHVLRNGRRQIIRFLVPGDMIGSLELPLQPAMSVVVALTPGSLADAKPLLQAAYAAEGGSSGLARLMRCAVRAEEAALRDHIVRLGGRTAYERLVHLVLELHGRLHAIGLADAHSFVLPVTQEAIADALGMSFVHTNRTLQQIRRDGLFTLRNGRVTIKNLSQMHEIAEWAEA